MIISLKLKTVMADISELNEQKRKVDFNSYDMSVKELISMVNDGIIDIAPEYQRQFRWDEERQSVLIESILLGIPVPALFMATNNNGTWEVIDGVQRLSTIINFVSDIDSIARKKIDINSPLKLSGLKKLKSFEGNMFMDLPRTLQIELLLKPLKITTLSDKSDKSVRFDLFERLNTGGIKLSDQEIRSCIYRGRFNDMLKELAQNSHFKHAVRLTESSEGDGTREEFVLRFFAYLYYRNNFEHSVVDFLNDYMDKASVKFDYNTNVKLFCKVFEELDKLEFGISKKRKRNITSVILFEAVAVGAAEVIKDGGVLNIETFYEWVSNKDFNSLVTGATNTKSRVISRIDYCKSKFSREDVQ